jgi:hypothetical protein
MPENEKAPVSFEQGSFSIKIIYRVVGNEYLKNYAKLALSFTREDFFVEFIHNPGYFFPGKYFFQPIEYHPWSLLQLTRDRLFQEICGF